MRNLIFVILILILFVGCGNYSQVKAPFSNQEASADSGKSVPSSSIDFQMIKDKILAPKCISCHTGKHLAYENYQVVKAVATEMISRIESSNPSQRMPQNSAPLAESDIELLKNWVENGAPEFVDEEKKEEEDNSKDPEASLISFAKVKAEILAPYKCTSCHTHFNNYWAVKKDLGKIVSLVISKAMPFPVRPNQPTIPVSPEKIDLLLKWVNQGAPEFSQSLVESSQPLPLEPTWLSLRNNVFGPKCILCHNSHGNRGAGFSFGHYSELRNQMIKQPKLIQLDNPQASHLIGAMLGRVNPEEGEFFYDQMPFDNPVDDVKLVLDFVSPEEIEVIKKWIELKMPYGEDDL